MSADLVQQIAGTILEGFNRHFLLFGEITRAAQERFESADWDGETAARRERIEYYDLRVDEAIDNLNARFDLGKLDRKLWQEIKRWYMWLLYEHKQPELAESFYNSVFCRLFDRSYFNNDHIFVKPGSAIDYLDMDDPVYAGYYPDEAGMRGALQKALLSFGLRRPWQNLERDLELLAGSLEAALQPGPMPAPHTQLHVVSSLFYRNKAAYAVGRVMLGVDIRPFVIPILLDDNMELYADTILTEPGDLALIFSFTRAYFMVDTGVPAGLVAFLQSILPGKTRADLYASIGFHKQGKTLFYREFLHHLKHSSDKLVTAPGIKGMVMSVFTLPSYPYVFKVIKDRFAAPKITDRAAVKEKYLLVKMHDRIGRMADTLEFSQVAFPIGRFSGELLAALQKEIASSIYTEGDSVIIRHLYIERRMVPFNIYLEHADEEMLERGVIGYGNAVKEMIAANIFPGDMLLKNFGVTRHNRVVFYDYDEIRLMDEIRIRALPRAETPDEEMACEPWFHVGENDFFPEQFESFVMNHPRAKERFLAHHADLLQPDYWRKVQNDILQNKRRDVFPYPQGMRFRRRYPRRYPKQQPAA
ncbi:MAG: bifunctional isocitrate dehydrogenase kinase/phosphatase [Gammaproteobacteria bacterium]